MIVAGAVMGIAVGVKAHTPVRRIVVIAVMASVIVKRIVLEIVVHAFASTVHCLLLVRNPIETTRLYRGFFPRQCLAEALRYMGGASKGKSHLGPTGSNRVVLIRLPSQVRECFYGGVQAPM
jgi:hypothetical protein